MTEFQNWANKIGAKYQELTRLSQQELNKNMAESFDRLLEIEREMKANNVEPFDNGMYCLCANKKTIAELLQIEKLEEWLAEKFEEWLAEKLKYSQTDRNAIVEAHSALLLSQGYTEFIGFVGNLMIFTKD